LSEVLFALVVFVCLGAGALGGHILSAKLPPSSLQDDTQAMVRLIANFLVVAASLSIGLMLNSAKTSLDTNNRNVHAFATELIVFDRTMRALGPAADEAHRFLVEYLRTALEDPSAIDSDPREEALFERVGTSLRSIRLAEDQQIAIWNDARATYRQAFRLRWVVADAAGKTLPTPLLILLVVWLTVIFVSFGYRAPRDRLVMASQFLAAALIAGMMFFILDMDTPTSGFVTASNDPLKRALTELER
jgi:hypothetical protein